MPFRVILNVLIYTRGGGNKYLAEPLGDWRKDYDRLSRLVWSLQKNPYTSSGSEAEPCIYLPQEQTQDKQPYLIFWQPFGRVYTYTLAVKSWMEFIFFHPHEYWHGGFASKVWRLHTMSTHGINVQNGQNMWSCWRCWVWFCFIVNFYLCHVCDVASMQFRSSAEVRISRFPHAKHKITDTNWAKGSNSGVGRQKWAAGVAEERAGWLLIGRQVFGVLEGEKLTGVGLDGAKRCLRSCTISFLKRKKNLICQLACHWFYFTLPASKFKPINLCDRLAASTFTIESIGELLSAIHLKLAKTAFLSFPPKDSGKKVSDATLPQL